MFTNKGNSNYIKLLSILFEYPMVTRKSVETLLGVSTPTANSVVDEFLEKNILLDMDPNRQKGKRYRFNEYLKILEKGTEQERD